MAVFGVQNTIQLDLGASPKLPINLDILILLYMTNGVFVQTTVSKKTARHARKTFCTTTRIIVVVPMKDGQMITLIISEKVNGALLII